MLSAAILLLIVTSGLLTAAERTWDGLGRGSSDWTDQANWVDSIVPVPGDSLRFPFGAGRLTNTNDYAPGTDFGVLTLAATGYTLHGNAIGLSGGLAVTHSTGNSIVYLPITLQANQTFSVTQPGATLFLNGDIHMSTRTLTFDVAGQVIVAGNIDNNNIFLGQLRKQGNGLLWLFQPADYDAATIINGGTVRVDGRITNSFFIVNSSGNLRGAGRIGRLRANSGGAVQPGFNSPDILDTFGDVELNAGSTFLVRLNGATAGSTYDQLRVRGTVTLGGALNITTGYTPAVGEVFTIIDNDGSDDIVGTFAGLPEGAEFMVNGRPFKISYGARFGGVFGRDNDVTIEAIPALAVWDGGGNLNRRWTLPLNWVGDVLPMLGDDVQFASTGSSTLRATNDFPAGTVFGSIIFGGGTIRLDGVDMAVFNGSIQIPEKSDATVLMPMTLRDGMRLTQPCRLVLGGPLVLSANQTFVTTHTNSVFIFPGGGGSAQPYLSITGLVNLAGHDLVVRTEPSFAFGNLSPSVWLSGSVIAPGSILKQGGGWMENHSAALAVPFTVQEGMVSEGYYAATAPVLVSTGAVLRASFFSTVQDLEVRAGRFIPGHVPVGNARFLHGAIFDSDIHYVSTSEGSYHSSQVNLGGQMVLSNCTLNLSVDSMAERIPPGSSFMIIDAAFDATLTGAFNGLPEGSKFVVNGYVFTFTYVAGNYGKSVALVTDVPFVWDGGGSGNLSTTPANWVGDFAPIADSFLVFPANVAKLGVLQDFPAGTRFRSLTFGAPSYVLAGNSFHLSEGLYHDFASGDTTIIADVVALGSVTNRVSNASRLLLEGGISGGTWRKFGAGTLRFTGALSNNLFGVDVREGEVELDKPTGVNAISRSLAIGDGSNDVRVTLFNDHQIDDSADVTIRNRARLDLNGNSDAIDLLQGDGTVSLTGRTVPGRTGRLTVNSGSFDGAIVGDGGLTKVGSSSLFLSGQSTFSGMTIISAGTLSVGGALVNSPIRMDGGVLSGRGSVGTVTGNLGGTLAPGASTPTFQNALHSGGIMLNAATQFRPLLFSVDPEFENSKLMVSGTVSLGDAILVLGHAPNFTPPLSKIFVILENDGAEPVAGTFVGLPEGAISGGGSFAFRISYVGGTGNDVTVTRVAAASSDLTSIQSLGNGRVSIQGLGTMGQVYDIQATSNLNSSTSWILLGRGTGDMSGIFQFIHSNAPTIPTRFYRAVTP